MSEQTLFNLIMAGITATVTIALAAIAAWKTSKLGAHSGAVEAMQPLQDTLAQNSAQLNANARTLGTIHNQANSQLEEFKELLRGEAAKAIAAAIKEGIVKGIEQERQRAEGKLEDKK